MQILIGGKTIEAIKGYPFEHANGKRELRITIRQSDVTYEELKEVLASNTGEIVLTKSDGTTQTLCGYKTTYEITDKTEDETAVFYVVIQCVAEAERRALEAQQKATTLENIVSEQTAVINAQSEKLKMQAAEIEAQSEVLDFLVMQ